MMNGLGCKGQSSKLLQFKNQNLQQKHGLGSGEN